MEDIAMAIQNEKVIRSHTFSFLALKIMTQERGVTPCPLFPLPPNSKTACHLITATALSLTS
jgi:hypothetical protein